MSDPVIKLENICKSFETDGGTIEAAKDINIEIQKGEIYGIIGLSGAGKSTLVRCINLLERPTSGNVYVMGENLCRMSEGDLRLRRRKIGMIFQHFNLLMQRNVIDNIAFPMEIAGIPKREARKRAMKHLEAVNLTEKAKAYPAELSGGQKQRVAIARVLASDPEILLCDEATSALDPETTRSILTLIKDINKNYGITVVVITHEMSVIQQICNRVAVLDHGVKVEEGTVEDLFRAPKTAEAKRLVFSNMSYVQRMDSLNQVRVVFDGKSAFEPIIGNITLELRSPINILYANTQTVDGNALGEMILQLPPDKEISDKIIAYFIEKGLTVEEVTYAN